MARENDWPERLAAMIEARRHLPFAWGEQDCCMWAADVVLDMTGIDFAAAYRGTYSTQAEAVEIITAAGGLVPLVSAALGEPLETHHEAGRGDVVCGNLGGHETLGIYVGAAQWVAPGTEGLVFIPSRVIIAAWGVA